MSVSLIVSRLLVPKRSINLWFAAASFLSDSLSAFWRSSILSKSPRMWSLYFSISSSTCALMAAFSFGVRM
ncbi:hypothetical protein QBC44DRAFT_324770 [Cladorrhinum sp. PSN332]|nr:hypothetical protein QBC44DRAFT_324770 [Cladorrhinum sp. PSN332]